MSFANPTRLLSGRNLAGTRLQGFVVNNDDSQDQEKVNQEQQRIKVRIPDLDDDIESDNDLPWYEPGNLPQYGGTNNVGFHGAIPPVGTKVWVHFEDDSRYHGRYIGGVQNQNTKMPDFTKWDSKNTSSGDMTSSGGGSGSGSSSTSGSSSSDSSSSSSSSGSGSNQQLPGWAFGSSCKTGSSGGAYEKSYPQAWGKVDPSGNFWGVDNKTDCIERTHCGRGTYQIDGEGNVYFLVNGGTKTQGSQDAKSKWPKGFTMVVFGDHTLYVDGNFTASVGGDLSVVAKGKANVASGGAMTVQSKDKLSVVGGSDVTVSAKGTLNLIGGSAVKIAAPNITSSVAIVLGGGGQPSKASADFKSQKAPEQGTRPTLSQAKDPPETEDGSSGSGSGASGGSSGGSSG